MRSGEWLGATGKPLTDVVAIGIGGSYLGPLFIHNAMQYDEGSKNEARGRCTGAQPVVACLRAWVNMCACVHREP